MTDESWTTSFDFMEAGRRLRRFARLERRLFELVGQWVQPEPDLAAKLQFGEQCYRHVRHAELLEALLPTPANQFRAAYADPIDLDLDLDLNLDLSSAGAALDAIGLGLTAADAALDSGARLRALYRGILAPLRAEYAAHLDRTNPITDAPTIGVLHLVLRDLENDLAVGERMLRAA